MDTEDFADKVFSLWGSLNIGHEITSTYSHMLM